MTFPAGLPRGFFLGGNPPSLGVLSRPPLRGRPERGAASGSKGVGSAEPVLVEVPPRGLAAAVEDVDRGLLRVAVVVVFDRLEDHAHDGHRAPRRGELALAPDS